MAVLDRRSALCVKHINGTVKAVAFRVPDVLNVGVILLHSEERSCSRRPVAVAFIGSGVVFLSLGYRGRRRRGRGELGRVRKGLI